MALTDERSDLVLPEAAFEDLAVLASAGDQLTPLVSASFKAMVQGAHSIRQVVRIVAEQASFDEKTASRIVDSLLSFHALRRTLRVDARKTIDLIDRAIRKQANPKWIDAYLANWKRAQPQLIDLLDDSYPLASLEKTIQLSYSYQNVLTGMRLLTELRPIFDASGESVARGLVTFVLSLEYSEGGPHRLDLALDLGDVVELKRLCERAERKASTLVKSVGAAWPTTIVGEANK